MSSNMPSGAAALEAWARSLELPKGVYRRRIYPGGGSPHPAVAGAVATLKDSRVAFPTCRPCLACGADANRLAQEAGPKVQEEQRDLLKVTVDHLAAIRGSGFPAVVGP